MISFRHLVLSTKSKKGKIRQGGEMLMSIRINDETNERNQKQKK